MGEQTEDLRCKDSLSQIFCKEPLITVLCFGCMMELRSFLYSKGKSIFVFFFRHIY